MNVRHMYLFGITFVMFGIVYNLTGHIGGTIGACVGVGVGLGIILYALDNRDRFQNAVRWCRSKIDTKQKGNEQRKRINKKKR